MSGAGRACATTRPRFAGLLRFAPLWIALLAGSAGADELPANACLESMSPGQDCSMDDGTPGRCVEESHSYVDAQGVTHTWKELLCAPVVTSAQRSVLPWVGFGLAFLALCAALATRRRPALARQHVARG